MADHLERVLGELSPSIILQNECMRSCFRRFLMRGTEDDRRRLLEDVQHSPRPLTRFEPSCLHANVLQLVTDVPPYGSPLGASQLTAPVPPHQNRLGVSQNTTHMRHHEHPAMNEAFRHFASLVTETKAALLAKIAVGFVTSTPSPSDKYLQTWSNNDNTRPQELVAGLCGKPRAGYASCFQLLFLSHYVDRMKLVKPRTNQKRKSAAFDAVSKACNITTKKVGDLYRRRRNYIAFAKQLGLGTLFETQNSFSDIESLTQAEVDRVCAYLLQCELRPFMMFNTVAARVAVQGLSYYGWKFDELAELGSELMELVSKHLSMDALRNGTIEELEDVQQPSSIGRKSHDQPVNTRMVRGSACRETHIIHGTRINENTAIMRPRKRRKSATISNRHIMSDLEATSLILQEITSDADATSAASTFQHSSEVIQGRQPSDNFDSHARSRWLHPILPGDTTANPGFSIASQQLFIRVPVELPYESRIFSVIQRGDIDGARELLTAGKTSIDAVDPYGLGLFYYASYYCWKSYGHIVAFRMCKALLTMGVNACLRDEIGNTSEMTLLDNILCGNAMGDISLKNRDSAVTDVAVLFGLDSRVLWTEYTTSRKFTEVHRILLRNYDDEYSLSDSLRSLEDHDMLSNVIDRTDSQGRSPLAWAVEYGWANAAETLISFGANPNQVRRSARDGSSPLLHLAIAGPNSSRSCEVVEILLSAGVDVDAKDEEQWTAVHIAASWGLHDIVKEIVQKRPDLSAVTNEGDTAFDLAIRAGADGSLVELLREHVSI